MKIGLITDSHYGFRKANKAFHEYFAKFYNEIFFPTLKKNKIKTVIHLGDAFDNRKGVDYWALDWAKENVYDRFQDLGITVYNIVGNHDAYYKNSNEINRIDFIKKDNKYLNWEKEFRLIEEFAKKIKIDFFRIDFLYDGDKLYASECAFMPSTILPENIKDMIGKNWVRTYYEYYYPLLVQ